MLQNFFYPRRCGTAGPTLTNTVTFWTYQLISLFFTIKVSKKNSSVANFSSVKIWIWHNTPWGSWFQSVKESRSSSKSMIRNRRYTVKIRTTLVLKNCSWKFWKIFDDSENDNDKNDFKQLLCYYHLPALTNDDKQVSQLRWARKSRDEHKPKQTWKYFPTSNSPTFSLYFSTQMWLR